VRKESKILKHQTKPTLVRGHFRQVFPIPEDPAAIGWFDASDDAQQGTFAAARAPQQAKQLT